MKCLALACCAALWAATSASAAGTIALDGRTYTENPNMCGRVLWGTSPDRPLVTGGVIPDDRTGVDPWGNRVAPCEESDVQSYIPTQASHSDNACGIQGMLHRREGYFRKLAGNHFRAPEMMSAHSEIFRFISYSRRTYKDVVIYLTPDETPCEDAPTCWDIYRKAGSPYSTRSVYNVGRELTLAEKKFCGSVKGANRHPTVEFLPPTVRERTVMHGDTVVLRAKLTDPDGDPVRAFWRQLRIGNSSDLVINLKNTETRDPSGALIVEASFVAGGKGWNTSAEYMLVFKLNADDGYKLRNQEGGMSDLGSAFVKVWVSKSLRVGGARGEQEGNPCDPKGKCFGFDPFSPYYRDLICANQDKRGYQWHRLAAYVPSATVKQLPGLGDAACGEARNGCSLNEYASSCPITWERCYPGKAPTLKIGDRVTPDDAGGINSTGRDLTNPGKWLTQPPPSDTCSTHMMTYFLNERGAKLPYTGPDISLVKGEPAGGQPPSGGQEPPAALCGETKLDSERKCQEQAGGKTFTCIKVANGPFGWHSERPKCGPNDNAGRVAKFPPDCQWDNAVCSEADGAWAWTFQPGTKPAILISDASQGLKKAEGTSAGPLNKVPDVGNSVPVPGGQGSAKDLPPSGPPEPPTAVAGTRCDRDKDCQAGGAICVREARERPCFPAWACGDDFKWRTIPEGHEQPTCNRADEKVELPKGCAWVDKDREVFAVCRAGKGPAGKDLWELQ